MPEPLPPTLADLDRRIASLEEAIKKAIDPERVSGLEKRLEELKAARVEVKKEAPPAAQAAPPKRSGMGWMFGEDT